MHNLIVIKKNKTPHAINFSFNACRHLGYFYQDEFNRAMNSFKLGSVNLNLEQLKNIAHLNLKDNRVSDINILEVSKAIRELESKSNYRCKSTIDTLKICVEKMEKEIAIQMCKIMGSKQDGFVFPYLNFSEFADVPIDRHFDLDESQSYQLHRARTRYNGLLETIKTKLHLPYLTCKQLTWPVFVFSF